MGLVHRPQYEELLFKYLDLPEVKVLKGVRRCGKSTLLFLLAEHLRMSGVAEEQLFQESFDEYEVPITADAAWLKAQLDEAVANSNPDKTFYVLLDEVQTIQGWEEVVRRLYKRADTQIFLTGSNAHLLSSELATQISGRYLEIEVMPLQFAEYRVFCEEAGWSFASEAAMFESFLSYGGMPGLFQFAQYDLYGKKRMLSGIFDTVIMNDVALHARITDFELLSRLIRYVFSTSGNLFSTKRVVDALSSAGRKTSSETVETYLAALEDALVLNVCEQHGLAGKALLRPQRKFYPIDNGLRNLTSGLQAATDAGFKLENVIYNQLRARGYHVDVGALQKGEVDFVATRGAERAYYQVALSVLDEGVYAREVAPLERIEDSFPKTVLVLDGMRTGVTDSGVRIESVLDWCG